MERIETERERDRKRNLRQATHYKTIICRPRESFSSPRGVKATHLGGEKITNRDDLTVSRLNFLYWGIFGGNVT